MGQWLGLDGNSSEVTSEHVGDFTAHNVVYDRGGGGEGIEFTAGELLEEGGLPTVRGRAVAHSIEAGMIPDIIIEYAGYEGRFEEEPANFPTEANHKLIPYVEGFIKTAKAIREKYPTQQIDFEPINEPYGYTTPKYNGGEYANVIAKLLPEASIAGIPLETIYVAAQGKNCANPLNKTECTNNGWVPAMYAADPHLREEIKGWYLHPYGLPSEIMENDNGGIQAVPFVQAKMTSGQNNIIVSEVGFCALDVYVGIPCGGNPQVSTSTQAAQDLTETLEYARAYHEAGWLRALIVYDRKGNGWSMQNANWTLTKQGEAFDAFANLYGYTWAIQNTSNPGAFNVLSGISCTSSTECTAVGHYWPSSGGPFSLAERWNGVSWSAQTVPNPSGTVESLLSSISCTSSSACTAVGEYKTASFVNHSLAERWNGTEWMIQEVPQPSGERPMGLTGVGCVSTVSCIAVGSTRTSLKTITPYAAQWNGTTWSIQEMPGKTESRGVQIEGVSCTAASACTAVGWSHTGANNIYNYYNVAERWNGTQWVFETIAHTEEESLSKFRGVSCTSSTNCVAVGTLLSVEPNRTHVMRWNGTGWSLQTSPNTPGAVNSSLYGISCASSTACTAVGQSVNATGTSSATLVEHWNGTEWSRQATPSPTGAIKSNLTGIWCASSATCLAGGFYETSTGPSTLGEIG
jgi:hypothetical protein